MNLFTTLMQRWGMLILCLFVGIFGVHKFVEKKTAMGFLYLFTFGLFGFGWLIDCIRYLMQGLFGRGDTSPKGEPSSFETNTAEPSPLGCTVKNVLLWILVGFLALFGIGCIGIGSVVAGIALIALAIVLLPIDAWQNLLSRFVKKKLKILMSVVLVLLFFVGIGTTDIQPDNSTSNASSSTGIIHTTTATNRTITKAQTTYTTINSRTTTATTTAAPTTTKVADIVIVTTTTTPPVTTTTVHIHSFAQATCILAETCSECGETRGEPLGHRWESASCTSPETCTVCGETGNSAFGHSYSDGTCVHCGSNDPDYTSEKLVWIPTNGGTKYHSHSSCSQMIDPEQVTESEAIALGFERCGRCKP